MSAKRLKYKCEAPWIVSFYILSVLHPCVLCNSLPACLWHERFADKEYVWAACLVNSYRGIQRTLGTHFISTLLLCTVFLCVITSWELAEGPTSLLRSVLLLSLLWLWLLLCVCVCVCVCECALVCPAKTHFRNGPEALTMWSHASSFLLFVSQIL